MEISKASKKTEVITAYGAYRQSRGAYHWGHSFAKQDIDDRILHCILIKKLKIAEPGYN